MEFAAQSKYKGSPRPGLIILDLNLPQMSGHEVLGTVKRDSTLRNIPVVMFSTSVAQEDVAMAYDLHANAYVVKPAELDEFIRMIQGIEQFLKGIAHLPSG